MSSSLTLPHPMKALPLRRYLVTWFITVHILGLTGLWYTWTHYHGATIALAVGLFFLCHLSITAGMHRLYAHRSYRATKMLEFFLLFFSAATFQYSALLWSYFHRLHHWHSDTDGDPYSVRHGFWWAHCLWIVHTPPVIDETKIKDLRSNVLVTLQDRYYYPLAFFTGLVLPTGIAAAWNDALGGLLVAGFLRLMLQYHSTWSINSIAHTFGFQKYGKIGTARLNPWLAISTVGENNHERHHLAHEDYRLGTQWYHLDIGKWFIEACARLGLAHNLRTVPEEAVLLRARRKSA